MIESAWIFVGRIAFGWTVLTLAGAVYADNNSNAGHALAGISGVVGLILWGIWTYGTLQIEVIDGGVAYTYVHPELTFLGIALALVPGYIALTGPLELVNRYRDGRIEDF